MESSYLQVPPDCQPVRISAQVASPALERVAHIAWYWAALAPVVNVAQQVVTFAQLPPVEVTVVVLVAVKDVVKVEVFEVVSVAPQVGDVPQFVVAQVLTARMSVMQVPWKIVAVQPCSQVAAVESQGHFIVQFIMSAHVPPV